MSGSDHFGDVNFLEAARKLGASATLQKPFTYDAFMEAINLSVGAQMVA
jgi:FixJ family two-component response regulator